MPRQIRIDWDSVRAAFPHGVVRACDLVRLGLPRSTVDHRCRARGGVWQRPLPGVVLMHSGPPSRVQQVQAALVYAGTGAQLTGVEACRRFGLRRLPQSAMVHLLVPAERRPSSRLFVRVERTTRVPVPEQVAGFPTAPLARAVLDAARQMRQIDDVRALLSEVVQRGLCCAESLAAELDAGCKAGSALPRAVLREVLIGVRSPAEAWALEVWRLSGLPKFAWNVPVYDANGQLLAIPDAWLDSVGLAWEIESHEWHLAPKDHARTVRRHSRLAAAGVIVVPTLPNSLRDEPTLVANQLVAAYEQAKRRPRPNVRMGSRNAA